MEVVQMKKLTLALAMFLCLATSAFAAININTADLATLESIPGIEKEKAQAIIDHRTIYGNFHSVKELTKVKGIDEKLLTSIKNLIEVKQ
jgi:competence protein ComEA